MSTEGTLPPALKRMTMPALAAGAILIAISAAALAIDSATFFRAYLVGYLWVLGLTLGSMGLLFLHHLVGGAWGFIIQRQLEAATRVYPVLVVLFLPILWNVVASGHPIYHWAEDGAYTHDALLAHKAPYLNKAAFTLRAVIYFVVWGVLIFNLNRWSKKQQESGDGTISNKLRTLGGPGIVLYMFTMTFAAFDWAMSLDPHWFSTIYGAIFVVGQVLTTQAFMVLFASRARANEEVAHAITMDRYHDLTKLMFAFTCLWAYVSLSQFLIYWYGNLPEEVIFFHLRFQGGWEYVTLLVVFGQFVIPFFLLLSRWPKRSFVWAPRIAAFIIVIRAVDLFWYVVPHPEAGTKIESQLHLSWVHFTAPLGMFALWLGFFLMSYAKRSVLPSKDPRWKEIVSHAH